jgi:hypothetical protein
VDIKNEFNLYRYMLPGILSTFKTLLPYFIVFCWGRRGCDRMVVGFINTYAIGAYHH